MTPFGGGVVRQLRIRRADDRGDDRGAALLLVVGAMVMITAVLLTTLAFTLQNATPTRKDQDAKTALAAAQAGIDEYVSRLTANDNYWQQANGDASNAAFGAGETINGVSGPGAKYTYTVLTAPATIASSGEIKLRITGTSSPGGGQPSESRTMVATLRVRGFLSYVYLSDVEVVDPDLDSFSDNAACGAYYYNGRKELTNCSNIQWMSRDTVSGPLHSNDALQINGAVQFLGRTTSSWPAINGVTGRATWWGSQSYPLPSRSPVYAPPVDLPVSNATMLQYVSPDVDGNSATPAGPGCYYQGATEILFQGTSMQVRSPMTSRSDTPSRCLNRANHGWQTISPIPPVIYVDTATSGSCTTGDTSAFTYPRSDESYPSNGSATAISWTNAAGSRIPNYSCMRGSAYVHGTASGAVTIASADDVVITGNLQVSSLSGTDTIGLVAGNCVWVYHPVTADGANVLSTHVTQINAAILALRHSFLVANWDKGASLGTLNVTGALAQKFRGPVGTGNGTSATTGYLKNYVYDTRLQNLQPPYFLKPTSTPWKVVSLVDG